MNKNTFLNALKKSLKGLPETEQKEIIHDLETHFQFAQEEGKSEEEISKALGSPQQIAKELSATYHVDKVKQTTTATNVLQAVWAMIGLGFFNLIIVLGPFLALIGVVIAGWAVTATFILSPVLVVVNAIIYPQTFIIFDVFFSFILIGLGIIFAIGMFYVTRILIKMFIRYLQFNMKFIKGGVKHA